MLDSYEADEAIQIGNMVILLTEYTDTLDRALANEFIKTLASAFFQPE